MSVSLAIDSMDVDLIQNVSIDEHLTLDCHGAFKVLRGICMSLCSSI